MNTWYITNKANIDAAGYTSETQVGPWAMYVDLTLDVADTRLYAPPVATVSPYTGASANCAVSTSTSTGAPTAAGQYFPPVDSVGSSFGLGIKNK